MKSSNSRTVSRKWDEIILLCAKCGKKAGGGFGPKGKTRLDKYLRSQLKLPKGKHASIHFATTSCFKVCPKNAVTVARGSRPGTLHVIPAGADAAEIAETLGIGGKADVITWPWQRPLAKAEG